MATIYSSRTCLLKFICSNLAVGLFTTAILITGAYPHPDFNHHGPNHHNQTISSAKTGNHTTTENDTIAAARLQVIQASNEALHAHLEEALARIKRNVQQNKELAEQISRSPRAIKTIQALEAAIAMFAQNHPEPEYQTSEYATGNKRWRHAPSVHLVPITYLLKYDVQQKHNKNKILGDKVAQVLQQNTNLSNKISKAYRTPSEKLGKDPVMALVSKTVATYMFIRHNNNNKNVPTPTDFSSWAEPFFKKKE
jgi:hypothetical protein